MRKNFFASGQSFLSLMYLRSVAVIIINSFYVSVCTIHFKFQLQSLRMKNNEVFPDVYHVFQIRSLLVFKQTNPLVQFSLGVTLNSRQCYAHEQPVGIRDVIVWFQLPSFQKLLERKDSDSVPTPASLF